MMMLSEIASALNAKHIGKDVNVLSVGTDSRNIMEKELFVALKGDQFDGNKYAHDAVQKGAAAVLISDAAINVQPSIVVADTRLALGELAHYWRKKFSFPIVAVTGSNGKTTVKEMIASILSTAKGNVLATKGNLNNDIGMPLTLLKLREIHTCAVIEMGMNHLNEIRYLSKIACPNIAVINNAGIAHIGELGSREAIAQAKGEVFEGLPEDGIAVINANDTYADYWKSLNATRKVMTFGLDVEADVTATYSVIGKETVINLKTPSEETTFKLHLLGKHNVMNVLAASAVALALDISHEDIVKGLCQFSGVQGRLNLLLGYHGATVIDDTYNANPDSMMAAIDVLVDRATDGEHTLIFVMGDMAELGADAESLHAQIGRYAKQKGITKLFSFGQLSQLSSEAFGKDGVHFGELVQLNEAIKNHMNANSTVLVKGSRMMKMERVVQAITISQKTGSAH